jgi:hypothetical protein
LAKSFDDDMERSIEEYKRRSTNHLCDEEWSIRHSQFGGYDASAIAHNYFSGQMFAPKVDGYEIFEDIVWLLSDHSDWLPDKIRQLLIRGTVDWPVWVSGKRIAHSYDEKGLYYALLHASRPSRFKLTRTLRASLDNLVEEALRTLGVGADVKSISESFIKAGYIEGYFRMEKQRRARR